MNQVVGLFNYWAVIVLMMTGLYILIARYNLIKKLIGLGVFQTSIFYLYITMGKVDGGTAPILLGGHGGHGEEVHEAETVASAATTNAVGAAAEVIYSNPVPHVLILTAIVVGVATTAVGLALAVRIHETFGTIEEDEIKAIEAAEPDS